MLYLLNIKNAPNPFKLFDNKTERNTEKIRGKIGAILMWRIKSDPFRIVLDYSLLLLLFKIFHIKNIAAIGALTLVGTFSWVYVIYMGVILYVFQRRPILRSDISLLNVGLMIAGKLKYLVYLAAVLLIGLLGWVVFKASVELLELHSPLFLLIGGFVVFSFLGLRNITNYRYKLLIYRTVMSPTYCLFKNIKVSKEFDYLFFKDEDYFDNYNLYKEVRLKEKPDIYFFCVESYGSVLLKKPEYEQRVRPIYKQVQEKLSTKGYGVASSLSTPPILAGGSWLSYTTFIYGTRISGNELYDLIFVQSKAFHTYESVLHFLKRQGYENHLLCPIGGYEIDIDWDIIKKNFAADNFFDWESLDYQGKTQFFFKIGPCPPDQFSINKANLIMQENEGPKSLFFCTLNSHIPYHSPTKIVENWEELNNPKLDLNETQDKKINQEEKYFQCAKYQLEFISDFIEKQNNDNALYVLFGDHQPPFVTKEKHGLDTPVHVITKNKDFLTTFHTYGFSEGMMPQVTNSASLRHEGFYSLFMKALNKNYGTNPDIELPYLPNGVKFKSEDNE